MTANTLIQIKALIALIKTIVIVFITICSTAISAVACATDSSTHPLYGKWRDEVDHCTGIYHFRPDGTMEMTEGPEVNESRVIISKTPDSNGFYRVEYKITKTNGLTGCDSEGHGGEYEFPVGSTGTIYVYFLINDDILVCPGSSPELLYNSCAGPFRRVR
jgi:hypothetical protein